MNDAIVPAADPAACAAGGVDVPSWSVRAALPEDLTGAVAGITTLLGELGGSAPPDAELHRAAHLLLEDACAGELLVALAEERVVGVLGASWTHAIRTAGRYAVIQELWVDPAWRSRRVGAEMIAKLVELARARGVGRIEVGLPTARFESLVRTRSFYAECGFEPLGERMRLALS
jgi:GNAT superfamily N-acetyltransferase